MNTHLHKRSKVFEKHTSTIIETTTTSNATLPFTTESSRTVSISTPPPITIPIPKIRPIHPSSATFSTSRTIRKKKISSATNTEPTKVNSNMEKEQEPIRTSLPYGRLRITDSIGTAVLSIAFRENVDSRRKWCSLCVRTNQMNSLEELWQDEQSLKYIKSITRKIQKQLKPDRVYSFKDTSSSIPYSLFSDMDIEKLLTNKDYATAIEESLKTMHSTEQDTFSTILPRELLYTDRDYISLLPPFIKRKLPYSKQKGAMIAKTRYYFSLQILFSILPRKHLITDRFLAQLTVLNKNNINYNNSTGSDATINKINIMTEKIIRKQIQYKHTLEEEPITVFMQDIVLNGSTYAENTGFCFLFSITSIYFYTIYPSDIARKNIVKLMEELLTIRLLPPEEQLLYLTTIYTLNIEIQSLNLSPEDSPLKAVTELNIPMTMLADLLFDKESPQFNMMEININSTHSIAVYREIIEDPITKEKRIRVDCIDANVGILTTDSKKLLLYFLKKQYNKKKFTGNSVDVFTMQSFTSNTNLKVLDFFEKRILGNERMKNELLYEDINTEMRDKNKLYNKDITPAKRMLVVVESLLKSMLDFKYILKVHEHVLPQITLPSGTLLNASTLEEIIASLIDSENTTRIEDIVRQIKLILQAFFLTTLHTYTIDEFMHPVNEARVALLESINNIAKTIVHWEENTPEGQASSTKDISLQLPTEHMNSLYKKIYV